MRRVLRRALLALLLLLALAAPALVVAPAPAAVHQARPDTKVQPAAVKSTLQQVGGSVRGRLTSSRDACVDGRDVYLIFRDSSDEFPDIQYVATTDANGRWALQNRRRSRQATLRLAALTLGGPRCVIAQSNQITYDPNRPVATVDGAGLADVAISLQGGTTSEIHGRITSSRSVCRKDRPVFVFYRATDSGDMFINQLAAVSKNDGSYRINEARTADLRRGTSIDLVTVVPGTNNCRPAQSPLRTYTS